MRTTTRKELVSQLLSDINYYRAFTKSITEARRTKPINDFAAKPDKLALLDELVTWCQEHSVQPRFWIYHLFAARRWLFPPQFKRGHLLSTKMLQHYRYQPATPFYAERLEATARERKALAGLEYDPNLHLSEGVETLKRVYASQRAARRCLDDMRQTYGYHPRSVYCQKCPEAESCEAKVRALFPFDIIGVRCGELEMNSRLAQETVWRLPHAGSK